MADQTMLEAIAQMMEASKASLEELSAHIAHNRSDGITVGEYREGGMARMKPAARAKHRGYIDVLVDGLPGMCWCLCIDCVTHREPGSRIYTCPCRDGACSCPQSGKTTSEAPVLDLSVNKAGRWSVTSRIEQRPGCQTRLVGLENLLLRDVTADELEVMMQWVQRRAQGRWVRRNDRRKAQGRPLFDYDGRSGVEGFVTATRAWFGAAVRKKHIVDNPAADLDKPERNRIEARALNVRQLEELWNAIFETGSDDVDLDMLMIWFHLETGARRGGAIDLTVDRLDPEGGRGRLLEKYGDKRYQPMSPELIEALLGFARARGAVDGVLAPDAPVFYYKPQKNKDGSPKPPRPLTERRYDTLMGRLRLRLPWADRMFLRPHDLRKTAGAFIERAAGHAVARAYLGHKATDVTGTYTAASAEEVRRAHRRYTGQLDR